MRRQSHSHRPHGAHINIHIDMLSSTKDFRLPHKDPLSQAHIYLLRICLEYIHSISLNSIRPECKLLGCGHPVDVPMAFHNASHCRATSNDCSGHHWKMLVIIQRHPGEAGRGLGASSMSESPQKSKCLFPMIALKEVHKEFYFFLIIYTKIISKN